ncbi:hypothetical protein K466DRAFT_603848 [Polyporus arcularius HHB13444]|uniref:DUF6533 domain-containing protein n=1 Tax=Polyporus arcularius HHB13444 TaxID=1314778 RepID=A0A5C3P1N8_9APHY|nr:hypothetical protein K466DRAFT_603848 [Polyporus arcularius HHB13444]
MSSNADAAAATVALFSTFFAGNYCTVASSVLFIYDTFITLTGEVTFFWTAKGIGGASLLFFANKWISMTVYVILLVSFVSFHSDKMILDVCSCSSFVIAERAMEILQFVPAAAFSTLRAYVLSRSKLLGLLVAALSLAPVGANLVEYGYQFSGENFPPFGCVAANHSTVALNLRFGSFHLVTCIRTDCVQGDDTVTIVSRASLIAADTILIYITWTKLRGWDGLTDIKRSKRLTLSDVLFRGGTVYFVILFIMPILHLVLSITAVAGENSAGGFSVITSFTAPITAILISRFLLKLQETNHMVVRLEPDDLLHSSRNPWDSTPSFISSLGGFINPELARRSDSDNDGDDLQDFPPSEAPEEEEVRAHTEVPEVTVSLSSSA